MLSKLHFYFLSMIPVTISFFKPPPNYNIIKPISIQQSIDNQQIKYITTHNSSFTLRLITIRDSAPNSLKGLD